SVRPFNAEQNLVVTGSHVVHLEEPVGRVSQSNRRAICFFMQGVSRLMSKGHRNQFLRLVKLVAAEFSDTPLLVREHPSYSLGIEEQADLARFPNIHLTPPKEYPMSEVLGA